MSKQLRAWVRPSWKTKTLHPSKQKWEVIWTDPHATPAFKQRTKGGFKTKGQAQDWTDEFLAKARQGQYINPDRGQATFRVVAEEWLSARHFPKRRTEQDLRQILLTARKPDSVCRTFGPSAVGDISYQQVREWLAEYQRSGKSATTARNNFYALRTVLDHAVQTGRIAVNPARQGDLLKRRALPSPKRIGDAQSDRYHLTAAQVGAIISNLPQPFDTYALLVASTGLRPGEACGLRVCDVDLMRGVLSVRAAIVRSSREAPKNDHSIREVTMDGLLASRLQDYIAEHRARALRWFSERPHLSHPGDDLALFVGVGRGRANGKADLDRLDYTRPLQHGVFYGKYWRDACNAAGVSESVTFYDLRHFHISGLVANLGQPGALDIAQIQQRAGHASKVMTLDRYTHARRVDHDAQRVALDAASIPLSPAQSNVVPIDRKRTN